MAGRFIDFNRGHTCVYPARCWRGRLTRPAVDQDRRASSHEPENSEPHQEGERRKGSGAAAAAAAAAAGANCHSVY